MKYVACILLLCLLGACATPPASEAEGVTPAWIRSSRIERIESLSFEAHSDSYVRLIGMVKAPGLFKVSENEAYTLKDLIDDAYGFERMAYSRSVKVTRVENGTRKTVSVDMSKSDTSHFILHPGDVIYVPEIMN